MENLTPEGYFDLYGSKRPNSNIVQTYRIRKKTNNHPNYPGSLDHIVYLVLFEGKFLKKSELYAYTYLPEYYDLPESYNTTPGKLKLSGVYRGQNLFIENPEVANSLGNCITSITVNGTQKPGGTGTTRVEIDFSYFDVKVGDDIEIVINYDTSCKIDVINPEAVLGTDDNVQTNNIGEINERYKKIKEATEKKLSDEESKVRDEKQEIDLAIYKIQKKPNDQITDEEKIELQNLKEKGIKMEPEWAKRIADIKVELNNIEKNKIQEINSNKSTIRNIERLVIAENLPINLTDIAIDKMGRNFDNLLLKALKIKNSNLEVFEDEFYTIEDFTFVPNESIIERDKLFGIADEIVEAAIKNFKYMDVVTDYEIIQYPWDPNDVPPESEPSELEDVTEFIPEIYNPYLIVEDGSENTVGSYTVRARGEYSVKVDQNSDKIKLTGLDGKFFLFPDGTRRELGELTLVKKENPNDPNIIRMINEEYERQDELSDEYLEDEYVGEGLGTTFGGTLGDQIKPEQTPDYVSPSNSSGSFNNGGGSSPINAEKYNGVGYAPIKTCIFSGESSTYDALNGGQAWTNKKPKQPRKDKDGNQCCGCATTYKKRFGISSMESTIAQVATNTAKLTSCGGGAMGRYQNMPGYIINRATTVGLNPNTDLYNEANQEKMGESLIDGACGNYIKGKNKGTKAQLESAIQATGRIWSSLPVVINGAGAVCGNVETGEGQTGYYSNYENNGGHIRGKTLADFVIALIKTRKNFAPNSFGTDFYKPSYINFV